jgi:hypothetical protein
MTVALNPQQQQTARLLYSLALQHGLPPARAREFVAASYSESGLNPRATNRSSGAAGLYQLLSSGYRTKAQQLGGLYDPRANALAILPNYQSYWQSHPNALPGEAGRDVERSGMGADFYSKPLALLGNLDGDAGPSLPPGVIPPQPVQRPLNSAALAQINKTLTMGTDVPAGRLPVLKQPAKLTFQQPAAQPIAAAAQPGRLGQHLVSFAASQIGQPYVWGGESRKEGGFDCSGLVDYALRAAGVNLPYRLTTYKALKLGVSVMGKQYQPGDMVIVNGGRHMVLYAGGGRVIAAPHRGAAVQYQPLSRFAGSIVDVRRI